MQKYMSHESTRMEGTCLEQNIHALKRKNLLTKSITLHYTNILLVEQHNVMYRLFSSTHYKILNFLVAYENFE